MQTVILAAGKGTRIRPLSDRTPKPMLPVVDRPLVAHTADAAVAAGADELVFVVAGESDPVRAHFGDTYAGVPVEYAVQESQEGTADALRAAQEHLDGPFVVLNGDNLYDDDSLAELYESPGRIGAVTVDNPSNYGVLTVEDGVVTDIVEKPAEPQSNLVNTGAYAFPAAASEWLDVDESERGELELTDVLARTIEDGTVTPVTFSRWLDVGRPWELLEANEWKLSGLERRVEGTVSPDAQLDGDVVVEAGAEIKAGTVIEGPAIVREGATVGPNAYVRGATVVGPDVSVGNAVEVKNSVLRAGTSVSHLSYVGDSLLGTEVNFGAGTTVANLRHDDEPVAFDVKGETVSTGRRKFGVVTGDGVKTGINTSLNAGVKLSSGATTAPGESVLDDR